MKTYVNGGHYSFYLARSEEPDLLRESPLKAQLQSEVDGSGLEKQVFLSCDSHADQHSINFVPPKTTFDKIKEIHVTLTRAQYERLNRLSFEIIRFGGGSSIDLYLVESIDDLI